LTDGTTALQIHRNAGTAWDESHTTQSPYAQQKQEKTEKQQKLHLKIRIFIFSPKNH
jgi:hypothetical protein